MGKKKEAPRPPAPESDDQKKDRVKDESAVTEIEGLLKRGDLEQWKNTLKAFSVADRNRGNVHFIEPEAVPVRKEGGPWGLRELCKHARAFANWEDAEEIQNFYRMPVMVVDLMNSSGDGYSFAEAAAEVNQGAISSFFDHNAMTTDSGKEQNGKMYKPPQRHEGNRCVKNLGTMRVPMKKWFVPVETARGVTDAMSPSYGVGEMDDGQPDLPASVRAEVEESLARVEEFQSERVCLHVFHRLFGNCLQYSSITSDMFVRTHDGRCVEANGPPVHSGYLDGTCGPIPSLYIERSGTESENIWFTKTHNEFGLLTFLNVMFSAGTVHESLDDVLRKTPQQIREAREEAQSFKLWIFVLHQEENLRRADAYAQQVHKVDTWAKLVDWEASDLETNYYIKLPELLEYGVDVAVAIQRVGDLVIGGPGVQHSVHQVGTSVAVAVNLADMDLIHMALRTRRGGDLAHRSNLKTHGARGFRWYDVNARMVGSIITSLEHTLDFIQSPAAAAAAAEGQQEGEEGQQQPPETLPAEEKARRLQRLLREVNMLGSGLERVMSSMQSVIKAHRGRVESNEFASSYKSEGWRELSGVRYMGLRDRVINAVAQAMPSKTNAGASRRLGRRSMGLDDFPALEQERVAAAKARAAAEAAAAKAAAAAAAAEEAAGGGGGEGPSAGNKKKKAASSKTSSKKRRSSTSAAAGAAPPEASASSQDGTAAAADTVVTVNADAVLADDTTTISSSEGASAAAVAGVETATAPAAASPTAAMDVVTTTTTPAAATAEETATATSSSAQPDVEMPPSFTAPPAPTSAMETTTAAAASATVTTTTTTPTPPAPAMDAATTSTAAPDAAVVAMDITTTTESNSSDATTPTPEVGTVTTALPPAVEEVVHVEEPATTTAVKRPLQERNVEEAGSEEGGKPAMPPLQKKARVEAKEMEAADAAAMEAAPETGESGVRGPWL